MLFHVLRQEVLTDTEDVTSRFQAATLSTVTVSKTGGTSEEGASRTNKGREYAELT